MATCVGQNCKCNENAGQVQGSVKIIVCNMEIGIYEQPVWLAQSWQFKWGF